MRGLLLALLMCAACDDNLAGVGQQCNSSGDCAAGLLCDFSRKPHLCEPQGQVKQPDMAVPVDLAGDDLSGDDLTSSSSHD